MGRKWNRFFLSYETGLAEILTSVFLFAAVMFALFLICGLKDELSKNKYMFGWLMCLTLGCVYFLGEEISWGQLVFKWHTPDNWMLVNKQFETNLHNLDGVWYYLFSRIPKTSLTLFVIFFGVLFPVFRRLKNLEVARRFKTFFAYDNLYISAALMVCLVCTLRKIYRILYPHSELIKRLPCDYQLSTEVFECLMAQFLMFYAWSMYLFIIDEKRQAV